MADEIFCPMCGRSNPADAEICWSCQARLKPLEASKPADDFTPDWLSGLRGSAAQENEPAPGEPAAEDADIPDWLARMRQPGQDDQPQPSDAAAGGDLPEWMRDMQSQAETPAEPAGQDLPEWMQDRPAEADWMSGTRSQEPPTAEPPAAQGTDSDWLASLANWDAQDTPADQPAESPVAEPSDQDDWVAKLSGWEAGEPAEPFKAETPQPEGEDWLASFADHPGAEAAPGLEAQAENAEWLASLGDQSAEETAPGSPQEQESGAQVFSWNDLPEAEFPTGSALTGQLPDWLAQPPAASADHQPPFVEDENTPEEEREPGGFGPLSTPPFSEEVTTPALPEEETPDWLKAFTADLPGGESAAEGQPAEEPPALSEEETEAVLPFASTEVPDWLGEPAADETPAASTALEGSEDLAMAQLPGWLAAMRPVETVVPQNAPQVEKDDRIEKAGPLAGIVGALPGESLVTQVRKPDAYSARLQVSERQQQQAALIEAMLSEEARPQPARGERSHVPDRVMRLIIALVLLAVVLLPLLSGMHAMPLPDLFQPDTVAFHNQVEDLAAETPVLLAVEYEPGFSGELQLAAGPVIQHLGARNTRLTLISTSPSGPVLAENLLRSTAATQSLRISNLGFLPGGTAGLQEFASQPRLATQYGLDGTPAWGSNALEGVEGLSNFGAVIVLTENAETARAWIEQVQPRLGSVPLLMVVSAQAAPMVQPYLDSGQVQGLVSGMSGGTMYAQISSQTGRWLDYWDAYQFGIFTAIAFILLGAVIQIISTLMRRPARKKV